jgi:hypothetical protein
MANVPHVAAVSGHRLKQLTHCAGATHVQVFCRDHHTRRGPELGCSDADTTLELIAIHDAFPYDEVTPRQVYEIAKSQSQKQASHNLTFKYHLVKFLFPFNELRYTEKHDH